jgi:hypothetical protein
MPYYFEVLNSAKDVLHLVKTFYWHALGREMEPLISAAADAIKKARTIEAGITNTPNYFYWSDAEERRREDLQEFADECISRATDINTEREYMYKEVCKLFRVATGIQYVQWDPALPPNPRQL